MMDERIAGWHRKLFGKDLLHSSLGIDNEKLMRWPLTVVLDRSIHTTKMCPNDLTIYRYVTLADWVYLLMSTSTPS